MSTPNDTPLKRCSKCGSEYPATKEYYRLLPTGTYTNPCIYCTRARDRARYQRNPEVKRNYSGRYYSEHKEEIREKSKGYRARNAEAIKQKKRDYYQRNKKTIEAKKRVYMAANADKYRAYYREYRLLNAARIKDKQQYRVHKRRMRILSNGGSFTRSDVQKQYKAQKGKCWHCGEALNNVFHVDHLIPLSKGGANDARNIVCSCPKCNLSKGDKYCWEWNGRLF